MSSARLRAELVQVAAVAAAIIEDLDTGSATMDGLDVVLAEIAVERYRQNEQWGAQRHTPAIWLAILAEEVGEAAGEVEPARFPKNWWELKELIDELGDIETAARWILAHLALFEGEE